MDMNVHVLSGRLTRDAELKYTSSGKAKLTFSLANNGYKEGDTSYFNCEIWGERGEKLALILTKGCFIGATGRTDIESWEKDGVKHTAPKIHVTDVTILYKPKGDTNKKPASESQPVEKRFEDEIPFDYAPGGM